MASQSDRKLYLGPRLRVLRRELGLNQTRMAEELGVSPSYLNHLERNQRPLTAQMLLRFASVYDIDMRAFVAGANEAAASDLHEIFADELVRDVEIPRHEIIEVAENYPAVADAVVRLFRALTDLRQMPERVRPEEMAASRTASPLGWLGEVLEARHNHFAELDAGAEALADELANGPPGPETLREAMTRRLADAHGTSVRIVPADMIAGSLRHYDYHRRRLLLSERLPPASRLFGIAYQLARTELGEAIAAAVEAARPPDAEARRLLRIALIDYAAAAIVMPYARFHVAAEATRYDVDLLAARFGASVEQVAHRLTTLDRQTARGVPFFLLKLDGAGNVAKRFAAEASPLARFGGGCPRWRVHGAWRRAGEVVTDVAEMPDGSRYLATARLVGRTGAREPFLLVLGCDARHAERIGWADVLVAAAPTPIGPACHLCERRACPERSLPPIQCVLDLDELDLPVSPYPFRGT
ncbi:short-chain fatty acyl-CoA regulator family protein [uncultured Sphingomonas sp.]|uniref:helix-turn-helix domain-containing protein n=1 Tax=uncultured Sphingomonas sp. TaxID=158754 RepID=UPI0035CBF615